MLGIYLHVPFCAKICDYCDFRVMPAPARSSQSSNRLFQEFADLLCREIELFEMSHPGLLATARTLYLGGGTPSILPPQCLTQLFDCLRDVGVAVATANAPGLLEVSMEFNPESTSEESVQHAMSLGVNRVSLGLQTFDPNLLKLVGRSHSVECGLKALDLLTAIPSLRVSGDLMFDLPNQTVKGFLSDVDRLSDYPLSHLSFYGLTVSERTVLGQKIAKGALSIDEDLYEDMYQGGVGILEGKGFRRYEVSNFAKPGFESVHNRNYWERGEYIGFGPGAHSFLGSRRFYAPEIYPRWRDFVRNGAKESDLTVDALNREDLLSEIVWLSLRQSCGLDLTQLQMQGFELNEKLYSKWFNEGFLAKENRLVHNASAEAGCAVNHTFLTLKNRGWIFMDDIVTDIMNSCSNLE